MSKPVFFEIPLEDITRKRVNPMAIGRDRTHSLSRDRREACGRAIVG